MALVHRLTALFLGGVLCIVVFAYINPAADRGMMRGEMADHILCPLIGMTPACTGVLHHLAHWQSTFAATLIEVVIFLALLIAMGLSAWRGLGNFLWKSITFLIDRQHAPPNNYRVPLRHALQEAFANGIIHSKAY